MKLIDYAPSVLKALADAGRPLNSTELTEMVFGESGLGSPLLTKSLFPLCIRRGWVTMTPAGRSKIFKLTEKGRSLITASKGEDEHYNWDFEKHDFKIKY